MAKEIVLGANKLNLEFEDEDEIRKQEEERRKKEEIKQVDLEFSLDDDEVGDPPGEGESLLTQKPDVAVLKPQANDELTATQQINLDTLNQLQTDNAQSSTETQGQVAKQAQEATEPTPQSSNVTPMNVAQSSNIAYQNQVAASSVHYNLGDELRMATGGSRVLDVEVQAKIKIAVMESKMELIAKHAQETKLLEYKINKLVKQIHAKAPGAKAELLQIRKLLAEHSEVKVNAENEAKGIEAVSKESETEAPTKPAAKRPLTEEEKAKIRARKKAKAQAAEGAAKKKKAS